MPLRQPPVYRAPRWLPGGHLQTLYPYLLRRLPGPPYKRVQWNTPDGDFIEVDWLPGPDDAPLVILFHGLEGDSRSHYARALLRALSARGWCGAVAHFRGCSGTPNRLPRAYHSGDHAEINWILRRFADEHPHAARFAVGVSLGGNALLKWLAATRLEAANIILAAAAVSAPMDLSVTGHILGQGFNRLYTRHFLQTLKPKFLAKLARFPGLYDGAALARARNLYEFDNVVTAPLHGFRDTEDYWTSASSKPDLPSIALPTLILNARNDPFHPGHHLPDASEVSSQVCLDFPDEGGHVGFVSGTFPGNLDWVPARLLAFFDEILQG
jgi:uncharacterized protein